MLTRKLLILCILALVKAQNGYPREGPYDSNSYYRGGRLLNPDDGLDDVVYGDEIPGVAGLDYPALTEVPLTGFNCGLQAFPGYYADPAADCQAFYVCTGSGRGTGFLCPNGTVFNQESLVCDWWYNFDCGTAVSLYGVNAGIAQAMAAVDAATAAARARGLGVLPSRALLSSRFGATGGRAIGSYGYSRPGLLAGRRRPLGAPRRLLSSSPRPVYGPPGIGGYRNVRPGAGRADFGRGSGGDYNNAPAPVYGVPTGGASNQYNNERGNDGYNYNRQSSRFDSFSDGGPSSSYGAPSRDGYDISNGNSGGNNGGALPDRQYLPPY